MLRMSSRDPKAFPEEVGRDHIRLVSSEIESAMPPKSLSPLASAMAAQGRSQAMYWGERIGEATRSAATVVVAHRPTRSGSPGSLGLALVASRHAPTAIAAATTSKSNL